MKSNSYKYYFLKNVLGGGFNPLSLAPILALQNTRIAGFSSALPIMKVRRENEGDEVDIYGWNPADPRQYKTSPDGNYVTDESLLFPTEQFFVVTQYDQSGNDNHATQTTAASQPELTWEGATFGDDKVVNGTFDNATGWTLQTGWSIGGGTLNGNLSANGNALQSISIENGKTYLTEFDVLNYTSGSSRVLVGGKYLTDNYSTAGKIKQYRQYTGATASTICYMNSANLIGSIDNYSIKEVLTWNYPDIVYDGVDDFLDLTGMTNAVSDYTFFARIEQPDPSEVFDYITDFNTGTGRLITAYPSQTINKIGYSNGAWRELDLITTDLFNASFVMEANSKGRIYENKNLLGGNLNYSLIAFNGDMAIGSRYDGLASWFAGKINSLYIYNTILTESQIFQINDYLDGNT